jgi:3',5'-cyclic AMP phosphodiesterase CpdA
MEAVRPTVRAENADIVVVLGDLVYPVAPSCPDGKLTPDAREELDDLVGGLLRDLGKSVYLVLGNHDVGHGARDPAREACLIDYVASEPNLWLPDLSYGVDLGVVSLMVLNTNALDREQGKKTRKLWAGASGWKILAGHHVLKTYHDKESEDYLRPWLKKNRVKPDLYANGHAHVLQFGVYGGLPALTSGATAKLREYPACPPNCGAGQKWGTSSVGYAVVDATADTLEVVFKDVTGKELYRWDTRRPGSEAKPETPALKGE